MFRIDAEDDYLENLMTKIIKKDSLLEPIDINSFTSFIEGEDYFLMLKQAATFSDCENFLDAYKYYKTISLKAFQDKEYLIYYISEFNRKHVGNFLISSYGKVSKEIESEIEELDLEGIYINLPYQERRSLEFLKEIQDFNLIYKVQNKLNKEVNVLKKTKRTVENGGFSFNSSLNKNFHIINNIWMFIEANYLCIDKYTEIQNLYFSFIEGIFASYSTQSNKNSKGLFSGAVNKIEELDLYEVYIITTKLKTDELENLLIDYNIREIYLKNQALEYSIKVLDKVIENILNNNNQEKSKQYLYNLLTLFSKAVLKSDQVNDIAKKLLSLINEKIYITEFKYLNKYIVSAVNKEILNQKTVSEYLERYLITYLQNRRIIEFDKSKLYRNLTNMYTEYKKYPIKKGVLSNIIELITKSYEEENYNFLYRILGNIIVPILKTLNEDYQLLIRKIIGDLLLELKSKKDSLQFNEFYFYYIVSINGIVTEDKVINKKLIEDTVEKVRTRDENIKSHPDPIESNLDIIADLYRGNRLEKEEIDEYMELFDGYSQYFDLIFNVFNSKDLNFTNIELLQYLKEEEIRTLMKKEQTKESIYNLLEEKLDNNLLNKYKDILESLYVKKY